MKAQPGWVEASRRLSPYLDPAIGIVAAAFAPAQITIPPPNNIYVSNVDYNASGQITRIEYGNPAGGGASGTRTDYSYDPLSQRLIHLVTSHTSQVTSIQDFQYSYDSVGNIVAIVDNVGTASQTFQYDALNRLITATGNYCASSGSSTGFTICTKSYQYDTIGNIIQKDGKTYSYSGAGPHAVTSLSNPAGGGAGGSTFSYDSNGNMIHKTEPGPVSWEYQYDSENRLTRVLKDGNLLVEYGYDGDGGRVKKTGPEPPGSGFRHEGWDGSHGFTTRR